MKNLSSSRLRDFLLNPVVILITITLLGGWLRYYHLGYKPLWLDEAVIYKIANNNNISDILLLNANRNSAPPLYVLLLRVVMFWGNSEIKLRSISWLAGTLSIPAIYYLSRNFIGKIAAFAITILVTIAPTQVSYSQELREYSLTFFLAIIILLFFINFLRQPNKINWILMTLSMAIGVMTQYGLSILILGLNIVFLIEYLRNKENQKKNFLWWAASQIVVILVVILVYFLSLSKQLHIGFGASSSVNYLSNSYWNGNIKDLVVFSFEKTSALFTFTFPGSIVTFLILIGIIFTIINRNHFRSLLLFLIPTLITWILSLLNLYPYDGRRQLIFLTPMIFILAGLGLDYLIKIDKKHWVVILLLLFPLINGGIKTLTYLNDPGKEDMRAVVRNLNQNIKEGETIYVYYGAEPAFSYYFEGDNNTLIFGVYSRNNPEKYFEQIDNILVESDTLWLVFSHCYGNECKIIPDYINSFRTVELISSENDAYLYFSYSD